MQKVLGVRKSAWKEMALFFLLMFAIIFFFNVEERFLKVCPHPFWIIVLLMSTQYGTNEGIASAILATFVLYLGNLPTQTPQETLFEYQYKLAWQPVLWLIAAFTLGEIRMRLENRLQEMSTELSLIKQESKTILESYQTLKNLKEKLETNLVTQLKTMNMVFYTLKDLGTLNPGLLLFNLNHIIEKTLKPKKFSIYALGRLGFEPVINFGWSDSENYTRRFSPDHPLYQAITGKQHMLCIINSDDQAILKEEGLLAAPLIDKETGEVFGLLKIEEIEFTDLNLSNIETFKSICDLIGIMYTNAKEHQKTQQNSIFANYTHFFSYNFYQQLLILFQKLRHASYIYDVSIQSSKAKSYAELEMDILNVVKTKPFIEAYFLFEGKRAKESLHLILTSTQSLSQEDLMQMYPYLTIKDVKQLNT